MANYFLNDDGTISKKKKKKKGNNYILQDDGTIVLSKEEDIAPVKTERTWFNTGAFDDGYDFGDVTKTILGTAGDLGSGLMHGVTTVGHNLAALSAGGVAEVADFIGKDEYADKVRNRLAGKDEETNEFLDKYSPVKKFESAGNFFDDNSLLGEKTDNLTSSAGSLLGAMALQSVGIPGMATMGLQAAGGELENAYKSGATSGEAWTSAAVTGVSEALIERLSGGISFGAKTLDDLWKKPITEAVTNKTASTLAKYGLDIVGEGAEEVITEAVQSLGRLSYEDKSVKDALFSEEARDNYIEAFIGGGVIGGAFSAKRAYDSIKTGRDYDTGLSYNEQRVIDSEVKNRAVEKQKKATVESRIAQIIEEREKTFGTLTDAEKKNIRQQVQAQLDNGEIDYTKTEIDKKELAAIEKQVREDLEKGNIGIDSIESTLSGFKTARINELRAELDKTTDEAKKAEIEAKISELTASRATELKSMLSKDVYLQESYRQEALKKESFARETTEKDSDITKELIESAKAAGMNNTRKMHDLFEYTNKIANDAKVKYGFVNSQQLKELGHEAEGATINGLVRVDKDGKTKVLINVDSDKSLNAIIGHETTHLLEGSEEYKALQDIVKQYATTKGEYDARLKAITKLYEGVDANVENEITADLVGDYLFTDEQFINNLSTNRNLFQKIYDYIKHAYKMATAGSREARELERVKKSFDKAYKQMSKGAVKKTDSNLATDADSSTKLSLNPKFKEEVDAWYGDKEAFEKGKGFFIVGNTSEALKSIGVKDQNIVWDKTKVKKILSEHPEMTIDIIKDVPNIVENPVLVMQSKTRANSITLFGEVYTGGNPVLVAMQLSPTGKSGRIMNMSKIASAYGRENAQNLIDSSDILYIDGNKKRTDTWLRALGLQLPVGLTTYGSIGRVTYYNENVNSKPENTAIADALAKAQKKKEERYSLSDSNGRKLSEAQQEYFKDSKVRDENGNLKAMYHGTPAGDFTVFKDGTYFTENKEYADRYQSPSASSISYGKEATNPKTYEVYLDIKKPFDINDPEARDIYINDYIKGGNAMGINPYLSDAEYDKIQVVDWTEGEDLRDFLIEEGYDYDGLILDEGADGGYGEDVQYRGKSYVVFNANQVKNVDNTNPTNNPDIRYSLSVSDYGMSHRPSTDYGDGSNFEENMPDVFEHPEWYFRKSEAHNMESLRALRKVRNNPEGEITIYRATIGDTINEGDWVSPSKKYAEMHNWHSLDGKGNILELKVKAKDIRFAGDDINEFGYFPNGVDAYSLSRFDEQLAEKRGYNVYGSDVLVPKTPADIAPVRETANIGRALTEEDALAMEAERAAAGLPDDYAPIAEEYYNLPDTAPLDQKSLKMLSKNIKNELSLKNKQMPALEKIIQDFSTSDTQDMRDLYNAIEAEFGTVHEQVKVEEVRQVKADLRTLPIKVSDAIKNDIADYFQFKQSNFGKVRFSNQGLAVDDVYEGLKTVWPQYFPEDIINPADQLLKIAEVANLDTVYTEEYFLPEEQIQGIADFIYESIGEYKQSQAMKASHEVGKLPIDESLIPPEVLEEEAAPEEVTEEPETMPEKTRKELRKKLLDSGISFVDALDEANNRSMALMNNTDTIRNTELVFGRENGRIINEAIFQPAIDNEAKSIAWQNKERSEIKELGIKARSKESEAVQKYGEGKYVNEYGDEVEYGDYELMQEFSDEATREKIKHAASTIRAKYDQYIEIANDVLTKLGFDPIPKRDDYMRHFQELTDVFSRYGIPFNAQNMKEHVLPTDINGLTEDWSPQKNYFANMQPRKGKRTTLDAITGIDGYIGGIANLIHHTEDIQRGRAFEDLIRETYGEEKGWEKLEAMAETLTPEEYQARADKIQNNHLSNYAAWVHEWTNNMAGKKNKADRAIEAMFGRRAFSFLDQIRKQVGSNMIGFNLSSSLTNLISPIQAMAKTDKLAVVKGTADTIKNIFVKDKFMEKNSFLTARMGTDMLSKTAWEKMQDAAYVFMKGMDWFSSNQIVRSKYYELRAKGMSEEQAHKEAGKFAARIMGDRTKGAQAQLYNSKLIGLVTQFQLEVNNQLYSMFYDTYHESKENAQNSALKTAAGMTFTLGQLFGFTHLFGKTFESIAGYNPTFDLIRMIATALGLGDDDEEKTTGERLEAAAQELIKALPYASVITGGGRIPIASALPIKQLVSGEDEYGNEKPRLDTLKETVPYYLMPAGYSQIKKTAQGLSMFDEDLPVAGSYTDSGNLRFPVEDTPLNRIQAGLFGQWASENANKYFDEERAPLKEKQIQEYKDLDIPIAEYWEYRDGLKGLDTNEEKFDYVAGLDLPVEKKNIMINNLVDRKEDVDLINYDDFGSYDEFDFAVNHPEEYLIAKAVGGYESYAAYDEVIDKLHADKDANGKRINGSKKEKVAAYINSLDADYGAKVILFKSKYPDDDRYNYDIIEYLNNRGDISYSEMATILTKLDFTVDAQGNITW